MYTLSLRMHLLLGNDSTLHPLLTALLLLWAEPSFPSMCNPAEPKQSVKAFVASLRIRASLISLGTAATDLSTH